MSRPLLLPQVVRSTKVTAAIIAVGRDLELIVRAGVGGRHAGNYSAGKSFDPSEVGFPPARISHPNPSRALLFYQSFPVSTMLDFGLPDTLRGHGGCHRYTRSESVLSPDQDRRGLIVDPPSIRAGQDSDPMTPPDPSAHGEVGGAPLCT